MMSYKDGGKRAFDLAVAICALILLLPTTALVAVTVWLGAGRPVLFSQPRPGLRGAAFTLWKFRTMTEMRDESGTLRPDSERLTRIGHFLRATSLDELPELFNVLRGDMSLVGPRPLRVAYIDRYTPEQARRHEVRPGITGWAQVNGRNALCWEDRFRLDVWYVDHVSFWLDLKILAMTARSFLRREGIAHDGHATMPEFMGNMPERRL